MKIVKKHKFKAILLLVIVSVLGIFTTYATNAAVTAPQSFTANSEKILDGYIDDWNYAKLTSSLGGYVYCRDFHKGIPYNVTMTLEGEAPAPIAYILSNGFPRTSITGDSDVDYYITQAALWWYMDLHMGTNNLPESFKSTGPDPLGLRTHILNLIHGAEQVTEYATPAIQVVNNDSTLNLSEDKAYYESSAMSVNTLYTTGNYNVTLEGAPEGTVVVNANSGATSTSFANNESFKVKIPVDNVDIGNLNITVKVSATGSINKAYMYKSSDPTKQSVFGSALYPETSTVEDQTTLTLDTSKVTITKIDEDTNQPLAGAEFVIKDSEGKEIATWTSTTNSYVIKNLPNGTYTLQETKAPDGYELNDKIVEFTITDTNRNISIRFKNKKIEKKATIIKIDSATKNPVAGATLVVKNSAGEEVVTFTTTTEPYVLNDIADGTYTVEEIAAPEGYQKTDEIYEFTIDNNNRDVTVTIENQAIEKLVNILKVDAATGKPLAGATLVVKDSEGNVIEEFVTTEEPHTITGLKDGTYTVEEIKAPEGYNKSDEVYKFTINDKTPTALVIFENSEIVEVPFTGSNDSLITTLFGSMMTISGVGFVYYNGKKQKVK